MKKKVAVEQLKFPSYQEIPAMRLYLKQVANYINQCLAPLGNIKITSSMVSNYVKHDLIASPEGRLYSREQIATLLFITIAKNVMDQEELRKAIAIQQKTYSTEVAYTTSSWPLLIENICTNFSEKFKRLSLCWAFYFMLSILIKITMI